MSAIVIRCERCGLVLREESQVAQMLPMYVDVTPCPNCIEALERVRRELSEARREKAQAIHVAHRALGSVSDHREVLRDALALTRKAMELQIPPDPPDDDIPF